MGRALHCIKKPRRPLPNISSPHTNEHRPITIWLLTALNSEALGGRGLALIFAALASIAGIIALVLHEMRRNGHAQLIGPGALVIALVLTVPTDVDCSIPANTIFPITVFFALAALVLAVRERMLMAVISALLSTFTNAGGLAVWPPLLWIASTRAAWPWRVLLLGMMAAVGAIFLLGTIHTQRYEAHSYWEVVRYWTLFVGLPWSRLPALQIPAAIFGIGLFAAGGAFGARADRSDDLEAGAVAFLLFSLGCSFMAALGRSGIHEPYPAIRYSIFLVACAFGPLALCAASKMVVAANRCHAVGRARRAASLIGLYGSARRAQHGLASRFSVARAYRDY